MQSVDISEGCAASGINNALREIMTDLKNVSTGAVALETPAADQLNVDNIRIDGNTISSTNTNGDITLDPNGTGDVIVTSAETSSTANLTVQNTNASGQGAVLRVKAANTNANSKMVFDDGGTESGFVFDGGANAVQHFVNGTNRMTIDSSGFVGFNKSSPTARLHAGFTGANQENSLILEGSNGSSEAFTFEINASGASSAARFLIGSGGGAQSEKARFDASGNMMVGTTSASGRKFSVESSQNTGNVADIRTTDTGNYNARVLQIGCHRNTVNGTYDHFACTIHGDSDRLLIKDSGQVQNANGSYTTISDSRMKENITDASSQWDDIKAVRLRNFNMIGDDLTQLGVVAQELEASGMTGLVGESNWYDVTANPDNEKRKYVKQSILYMKALGALQEAIAKIETLETQRADLETRLTALENA